MRRRLALLAVAVLTTTSIPPAASQAAERVIEADPATVSSGGSTLVRGRGFTAGLEVRIHLDTPSSAALATGNVLAGRLIELTVSLGGVAPGDHLLIACAENRDGPCAQRAATSILVLPSQSPTTSPPATTPPTTSPPIPPGPPDVGIVPPVTVPPGPGELAATTTSIPDPPADPNPGHLLATTTTSLPTTYVPPEPLANASLAITAVEVTQGMQNLANEMPLVVGRRTVARVLVETDGDDALVRGRAGLFRNGALVASLDADNQPVHATAEGSDRIDLDSTLQFTLPAAWTTAGDATLWFFVYEVSAQHTLDNDDDPSDNFMSVTTHFHPSAPLQVVLAPVHLHTNFDPTMPEVTWDPMDNLDDTVEILQGSMRYLPISSIDAHIWPTEVMPANHLIANEFDLAEQDEDDAGLASEPHVQIVQMRDGSTYFDDHRWYGTLPTGITFSLWSTSAEKVVNWGGLASSGVSIGRMSTETWAGSPWRIRGSLLIGHELGHNYGLGHVDCKGTEADGGDVDADFPTPAPDCSIAPVDPGGWYGLDVYGPVIASSGHYTVISNDPTVSAPNRGWPLMGYEKPEWLDPYAYCRVLPQFQVPCSAYPPSASSGAPGSAQPQSIGAGQSGDVGGSHHAGKGDHKGEIELMSVSWAAVVDPAAGTGSLRLVKDEPDVPGPATEPRRGEVLIEVLDAAGSVLGTANAGGDLRLPHELMETGETAAVVVNGRIGVASAPAAVRLLVNGVEVDRVVASPTPPEVALATLEGPSLADGQLVSWTAADADGDPVTVDVGFSPDGGDHWVALATGVAGTSVQIAPGLLPATVDGVLRVRAHDGFHTTLATIGGLSVADQPPSPPMILAPLDGAQVRPFQSFTVEAQAADATDRTVRTFSVASDVVGALGSTSDGRVDVSGLPAGRHVLTVTAVDSHGGTSEGTVEVDVAGDDLIGDPGATEALVAVVDGTLDLSGFRSSSGGPTGGLVVAAGISVAAIAAAVVAVGRARRAHG